MRKYGEPVEITTMVAMTPRDVHMNDLKFIGSIVSIVSISLVNLKHVKGKNYM